MKFKYSSRLLIILIITLSLSVNVFSQKKALIDSSFFLPSHTLNINRVKLIADIEVTGFFTSIILLNETWYKHYPRSDFHFFNDNNDWLQIDKVGHTMTSYYIGKHGMDLLKWAGVSKNKAIWYGGTLGLFYLTTIEVMDGFSKEWGASSGDIIANIAGTTLLIGQEYLFDEQKFSLKFSVHRTSFAEYRPEVFGKNLFERFLKDYNGQTYWLSFNPVKLFNKETRFPEWLNISFGYGVYGLTGGTHNLLNDKTGFPIPEFNRLRQFYFAPDIDLTKIKTKSYFLNTCLKSFGFIKFPLPTLEITKIGAKGYLFYF